MNNFTISGSGGVTSQGDFTIDGILNLQSANPSATVGLLDMFNGSSDKTLTMGANATTIGQGDVTGIVKRTTFLANVYYTMGNQYTAVSFQCDVSYPTVVQVNISIGATPSWKTDAVKRVYDFIQSGGNSCRASITTHYLDSELNGNTENMLSHFTFGTPGPPAGLYEWGKSNSNSTQNWVSISNVDISNFPSSFNTLQNTIANTLNTVYVWDGSESTDWNTAANWTTNVVPVTTSEVIIPDATTTPNDPILPSTAEIQSLNIQTNGILNSVGSEQLTINGSNGAWNNDGGAFNASSSTVFFSNANASIAGTTSFYNLTINSSAALTPETDCYIGIAGTLTNNGILRSGLQHNTIEYSTASQTVVLPNGPIAGYHNLILSGSGTKTMPGGNFSVLGDFNISGTAAATAASDIQVSGYFNVGSNTLFNTNANNLSVGGDLTLDGTFTTTGSTVTFNGTAAQVINGSNTSVTFDGLSVQNTTGLTTNKNIIVNGELNLQSVNPSSTAGALDMGIYTLLLGGSSTNTGIGDVSGIIRRTSLVPDVTYTFGNSYSTVKFNNTGTLPSEIQIKITLGNPPVWKPGAIERFYEFVQIGGVDCFGDVAVHYLDSELAANDESKLVYWGGVFTDPMMIIEWGVSNVDLVNNSMMLVNVGINLWPTAFGMMQITIAQTEYPDLVWDGSESTIWDDPNNWTPIGFPDKHKTATIPDATTTPNDPTLVADAQIETLVLQSGSILNALDNNTFSLYGTTDAWKNEGGTFNFGTGTVVFIGDGAGMSGNNYFNNVTINSGAKLVPDANNIMHIAGTFTNNGTLDATTFSNTIEYNGSNQPVIAPNGSDPGYDNLILSGSGTKTMPSIGFEVHGDFTLTGTVSATALAEMHTFGNLSIGANTNLTTGPFEFHVGGNFVHDGIFDNTGGLVCIDGDTPQTLSGAAALTTFNTLRVLNTNISGLTIDKNISTTNLIINSTGGITSNYSFGVSGTVDLRSPNPTAIRGALHMGSNTLNLGASATISSSSISDITGIVKRTTILPETRYAFNNYFASVYFANTGTLPTEMSVRLSIGTDPAWKTGAVKRIYEIAQTGAVYGDPAQATQATIQSFYLDSELNGNDKTILANYSYINPPGLTIEHGRASHSETENWISIVNVNIGFFPSALGAISVFLDESEATTYTWNGSTSTSWTTPANWTPNGSPSFNSDVIIPDAATTPNDPYLNSLTETKTLTIQSGGILNAIANAEFEIYGNIGAWNNAGTFNAETSTVIFSRPGATMEGETHFYNVTIESGSDLTPQTNNIMHIAGTLLNEGTLDAAFYENTIDYNGANQTVIIPTGSTPGYYNLILSGSGTKTMPTAAFDVFQDLTLSGTVTATAGEAITTEGSVNIGSGTTFITGNYTHQIAGNFINDGTFTSSVGGKILMDGIVSQSISGTGAISFYDLEIDNSTGVSLSSNIAVNNILSLVDGTLTVGANSLTISGQSPTRVSGNVDASNSSATVLFTNSLALTLPASTFTGDINNITMNGAGGITLGSDVPVSGILALTNGIITTGTNTLTVNETGSISGGSSSSFINGKLARTYNTTNSKLFPVGKSGVYKPLTFEYTNLSGTSTVTAEQFETAMTGTLPANTFLGPNRYWTISQTGGTNLAYNITLDATGYSYSPNYPKILQKDGTIIALNASDVGSFFTSTGLTGFGDFALGCALAPPPTTQAQNIVFSSVTSTGFTINWTNGNGVGRVVFMKEGSGIITNPVYGTVYTASNDWSSKGDQLGTSGYYCVYNGTGSTVSISNLLPSTTYWVQVFEYNESGVTTSYLTTTSTNNPNSQLTLDASSTVEIADYKGWRMISSPRATDFSDLLGGFVSQGITGSTYPAKQPNIMWFDETDAQTTNMSWRAPSNMSASITPGCGYYFYVFGNVAGDTDYNDVLPITMEVTGSVLFTSGTFNFSGTNFPVTYTTRNLQTTPSGANDTIFYDKNMADAGWNMVGNPATQTIDWDNANWTKTNIDNSIYIWDPSSNSGNGDWKTWNGSTGTLGSGLISPFQAFWVKANATSPVLSFTDAALTTGGTFLKSQYAESQTYSVRLILESAGLQTSIYISFTDKGVEGADPLDAYYLEPLNTTWLEMYSLSSPLHNKPLVINNLPLPDQKLLNLPLFVDGLRNGQALSDDYSISWELPANWPADWAISLQDNEIKKAISMNLQQQYNFYHVSDDRVSNKSAIKNRLKLPETPAKQIFSSTNLKSASQLKSPFNIIIQKGQIEHSPEYIEPNPNLITNYPNPFSDNTTIRFSLPEAEKISLSVIDMVGRRIRIIDSKNYDAGIHEINWRNTNLITGIYLLQLETSNSTDVIKLNIQK